MKSEHRAILKCLLEPGVHTSRSIGLALGIKPNTISHQADRLKSQGLVKVRKERVYAEKNDTIYIAITAEGRKYMTGEPTAIDLMLAAWARIKPAPENVAA